MKRVWYLSSLLAVGCSLMGWAGVPEPDRVVQTPAGPLTNRVIHVPPIVETNQPFSVSFDIKFVARTPKRGEGMVFSNGTGYYDGMRLTAIPQDDTHFRLSFGVKLSGSKGGYVNSNTSLILGTWYSVALTWDGQNLSFYLDGILAQRQVWSAGFTYPKADFAVGASGFGMSYHPFEIRQFGIWKRSLSGEEVLVLSTGGVLQPDDVARYLQGLDRTSLHAHSFLAWQTAEKLLDEGKRALAIDLYTRLANDSIAPKQDPSVRAARRMLAGLGVPPHEKPLEIYVEPNGNDRHRGDKAHPFATFERARDYLRSARDAGLLAYGAIVWLRGGIWARTNSFVCTALDSGTPQAPIVWRAYAGEKPIIDGSRVVAGLKVCGRGEILSVNLREQGFAIPEKIGPWGYGDLPDAPRTLHDLYEDDVPCTLARHPNTGWFLANARTATNGHYSVSIPDMGAWAREPNLTALGYWNALWADKTMPVRLDAENGWLYPDARVVKRFRAYYPNVPFAFVNVLKALDQPGEWHLDYASGQLYVWPKAKGSSRFRLSVLKDPLWEFKYVEWVRVEGLTFEGGQGLGVRLTHSKNVDIMQNVFRNLGSGLNVTGRDITIAGNRMRSFAKGAITIYGGNRKTLEPSGIVVRDNDISDIERHWRTYCPALHVEGVGTVIANNYLHNCPSSAMRLEGNDILVVSNIVEDCVIESDDQGAIDIYANPTYAGIRIEDNLWRRIGRKDAVAPCGQAAVRFDDVISGVIVKRNRFYDCGIGHFGAIQVNGGRLNEIDNNLFVRCSRDVSIQTRTPQVWNKIMTNGYAKAHIDYIKVKEAPYAVRLPHMAHITEWPSVNFVSRNVWVDVGATTCPSSVFGNRILSAEPTQMPVGCEPLPPLVALGPQIEIPQ